MISNERPSPYGRRPYQGGYQNGNQSGYQGGYQSGNHAGYQGHQGYGAPKYNQPPRPPVQEDTLKSAELQVERKFFVFALKENPRGRFLRITEDVGGRRDTIIIPSTGLAEFKKVLDEMVKASESIPEKQPNPEA